WTLPRAWRRRRYWARTLPALARNDNIFHRSAIVYRSILPMICVLCYDPPQFHVNDYISGKRGGRMLILSGALNQGMRYAKYSAVAAIIFFSLLCAQPALAQGTADLVGRVTDASGAVLPGATVTAENAGTNNVRTTITSETGDYAFNLLPIGTYAVK